MIDFTPLIQMMKEARISEKLCKEVLEQVEVGLQEENNANDALSSHRVLLALGSGMKIATDRNWTPPPDLVPVYQEIKRLAQEVYDKVYLPKHATEHGHALA